MSNLGYPAILDFWFDGALNNSDAAVARVSTWFKQSDDFDAKISDRFADLPQAARLGRLNHWAHSCEGTLAMILVLDQFPRNLFRDSPGAFAYDALALSHAEKAIEQQYDRQLHPLAASFMYLPFEHAEHLPTQNRSVALFEDLLKHAPADLYPIFEQFVDYAHSHRQVIKRFGRFPHRNTVLGRSPTKEELDYLASGGETYGGSGHPDDSAV